MPYPREPFTYTVLTPIRDWSPLPNPRRGVHKPGRFSLTQKGGRSGLSGTVIKIEMHLAGASKSMNLKGQAL